MEFSVQADNLLMLREAVRSNCGEVRFGSEFCEYNIPSIKAIEEAYALANHEGKEFVYVTPRVSNRSLEKIRKQLAFLNGVEKISIVVNDFGVLNILKNYPNLKPHLGRQLIYIPARCPWKDITPQKVGFLTRRRVAKIFYQTSLNYLPTIKFFQSFGIRGVDVDWIPRGFPFFGFLVENELELFVHLYFLPAATTRMCHTARFLGEKNLESCSKPCLTRAFLMENAILGIKLYLHGNTVFRFMEPTKNDVKELVNSEVTKVVVTMNPITKVESRHEIDVLIRDLQP